MNNPSTCKWSEVKCEKPVKKDGYCLKHHARGVLLEESKKKGVRICDDGKRACRNETFNHKVKCEECLKKTREREISQYNERKASGVCTMCGTILEKLTKGIKEDLVQKCEACYSTMRKVEDNRIRDRNYAFEKKINPLKHFREYADGAAKRNIEFTINLEEFTEVVKKPCYYCKKYNETEVLGIDRIDSFKGYVKGNILPACEICNTMKKQLTMQEFANHIALLYRNFVSEFKEEITVEETSPSYRFRPAKIVEHYYKRTLNTYIEICKADNRSAAYIQKLIDATAYTMTNTEFRDYLENASRIEVRSQQLTLNSERKRVPRKEIFALLKLNKPLEVVKLYESVFGKTNDGTPTISPKIPESQNILETPLTQSHPKQWKVSNILTAFKNKTENSYKQYLESIEDIKGLSDWEQRWKIFVESLQGLEASEAQETIKGFIESLRAIRHNALSYKKNDSLLDREDREVWRADTILRAFKLNKLDKFKEFTEASTGDKTEDSQWNKRWQAFVSDVYKETDDTKKKKIISKFLAAQRTKKFRKSLV